MTCDELQIVQGKGRKFLSQVKKAADFLSQEHVQNF